MIVVPDASIAVKWYIDEKNTAEAEVVLEREYELHAPELLLPEFGSIIWKKVRRDELISSEASKIVDAFSKQNITFHSHKQLFKAAYAGAEISGQTIYDWMYLALAVSLSCQFITADLQFYKVLQNTSLKKHIVLIEDVLKL